jgi:GTP cyclohydrolase I
MKVNLNHEQIRNLAARVAVVLYGYAAQHLRNRPAGALLRAYAVPCGGVPAAYALRQHCEFELVDRPEDADVFIDDLIDSGATCERYCDEHPGKPFFTLIDKRENTEFKGLWIVFPWEVTDGGADESGNDIIVRLLQLVGEDANREGLLETPARVIKAWRHWCSGYGKDPAKLLKVFGDGAERHDQMVTVRDIPIYSHCEHHLAPIFGTVTISYIPNGKIVGLSKLSRLADMFARRLQVQERLTDQIADALFENLEPKGVGVVIKARHMCMESRGICQQGHHTVTTALRGAMRDEPDTRAEFLRLAN